MTDSSAMTEGQHDVGKFPADLMKADFQSDTDALVMMDMSVRFLGLSVLNDIEKEIAVGDRELDHLLKVYAEFETDWNNRMKEAARQGDPVRLADMQTERSRLEEGLGIDSLVERVCGLRQARVMLSELIGKAAQGLGLTEIASYIERHFSKSSVDSAAALWLAELLTQWVRQPICGSDVDRQIGACWWRLAGECR